MAPGAPVGLVGADNESIGSASVEEALASRGAFSIAIRRDVVPLDVDDPRPEVLATILGRIADTGREYLVFDSGRPGHHHLYVPCHSETEALSAAQDLRQLLATMEKADVTVLHSRYLRPPGAPHRLGLPTSPQPVAFSTRALEVMKSSRPLPWQPNSPATSTTPAAPMADRRRNTMRGSLDYATYALLVHGQGLEEFRSRSEAVFALCRGMCRAGWTEDEARDALYDRSHLGGEAWRSIRAGVPGRSGSVRRKPRLWLRNVWAAAARSAAASPRGKKPCESVEGDLSAWLGRIDDASRRSLPRRLSTVMLVASRLASIADAEDMTCRGSLRSIAEASCLDPGTVQSALHHLEAAGFLERLATGRLEVSGAGASMAAPSVWRVVTVSGMGGTTPPGAGGAGKRRTLLPDTYGELDSSLSPAARWLLLHLIDDDLTLRQCAQLLAMSEQSLLKAQTGRRSGALRQLVDLGLVRSTSRGSYEAHQRPTKKAASAARRVRFHGRRAVDRRRRMQVRHGRQRAQAVERLEVVKRERMAERIADYYRTGRGLPTHRAQNIAEATVRKHLGGPPVRKEIRQQRVLRIDSDDGSSMQYSVGADEVVVSAGDAAVTRRLSAAGARKVWVLRYPFAGAPRPVWQVQCRIISASHLIEAVRDLRDLPARLRRLLPHEQDLAVALSELEPVVGPYQRKLLAAV